MTWTAIQLKNRIRTENYILLVSGVLLFLLSDSLIGWNAFRFAIPHSGLWVMSSYIGA